MDSTSRALTASTYNIINPRGSQVEPETHKIVTDGLANVALIDVLASVKYGKMAACMPPPLLMDSGWKGALNSILSESTPL